MFCLSMFCRLDVLVIRCFKVFGVLSVSHGKYILIELSELIVFSYDHGEMVFKFCG